MKTSQQVQSRGKAPKLLLPSSLLVLGGGVSKLSPFFNVNFTESKTTLGIFLGISVSIDTIWRFFWLATGVSDEQRPSDLVRMISMRLYDI